jgi:flagellar protein FlaH
MNHYSLGLTDRDRVDNAFGGGFPTGSVVLIEGVDGAGKSVISQRCLYGMLTEGTSVGYLSTELTSGKFIDQMHSLNYDVVPYLLNGRLLFFRAPIETATAEPAPLLSRLVNATALWQADVVYIDSFGALFRNDSLVAAAAETDNVDRVMDQLVRRFTQVTEGETTIVLTTGPHAISEDAAASLRSVVDVLLELETNAVGQDIRRSIRVKRFAGMQRPVDDTIGFSVQQGRGLTIESRTIA